MRLKIDRKCKVCGKKVTSRDWRTKYCEEHMIKNRPNLLYNVYTKLNLKFLCKYAGCRRKATSLINQIPYCTKHFRTMKLSHCQRLSLQKVTIKKIKPLRITLPKPKKPGILEIRSQNSQKLQDFMTREITSDLAEQRKILCRCYGMITKEIKNRKV